MLCVRTFIKPSTIHGIGLFADQFIAKETIIWRFTSGFDLRFTLDEFSSFTEPLASYMQKYSWLSKKSGLYCFASDNGKYFNHSDTPNTLSKYINTEEEVITVALRDIFPREELTDNYHSFEADCDINY